MQRNGILSPFTSNQSVLMQDASSLDEGMSFMPDKITPTGKDCAKSL